MNVASPLESRNWSLVIGVSGMWNMNLLIGKIVQWDSIPVPELEGGGLKFHWCAWLGFGTDKLLGSWWTIGQIRYA